LDHRSTEVDADIGRLVGGKDHRLSAFDAPFSDLLIIDIEGALPALAQTATVIDELEAQLDLACRQRLAGLDRGALHAEEVVVVGWHPVLDIQRPAAEAPALGDHG